MMMGPTNFMPRFFKSFEMVSDNGELILSTSSAKCPIFSSEKSEFSLLIITPIFDSLWDKNRCKACKYKGAEKLQFFEWEFLYLAFLGFGF